MNLANIEYQDKLRQYVLQMRPVFKPNALFSDETANYVTPMEPDPGDIVTIRFRTWKDNVDKVYLVSNDRHLAMEYEKSEGDFDYFKIRLVMQEESVRYFLRYMLARSDVSTTRSVYPGIASMSMILRSHRVSTRRNGQKVLLCTRSLWIVFQAGTRTIPSKTASTITSATTPGR